MTFSILFSALLIYPHKKLQTINTYKASTPTLHIYPHHTINSRSQNYHKQENSQTHSYFVPATFVWSFQFSAISSSFTVFTSSSTLSHLSLSFAILLLNFGLSFFKNCTLIYLFFHCLYVSLSLMPICFWPQFSFLNSSTNSATPSSDVLFFSITFTAFSSFHLKNPQLYSPTNK